MTLFPGAPDTAPPPDHIQTAFEDFHEENPHVYAKLVEPRWLLRDATAYFAGETGMNSTVPVNASSEEPPMDSTPRGMRCVCFWCHSAMSLHSRRGRFWCGLFCLFMGKPTTYLLPAPRDPAPVEPARVDQLAKPEIFYTKGSVLVCPSGMEADLPVTIQ